jgi:predicted kinase
MDNNKYLFLITGAAGAGKSTLAQKIQDNANGLIEPISEICEADEFWYILGKGKYAFNPKLLWKAHKWCQNNAKEIMMLGLNLIVSNTNIKPSDRKAYFNMADEYGYKVVFIHLTTQFQNQHGVPDEAVKRMREGYVDLTSDEKAQVVKSEDMSDELIELLKKAGVKYAH